MTEPTPMATPGATTLATRESDDTEGEPPSGRQLPGLDLDIVIETGNWPAACALQLLVTDAARAIAAEPSLASQFVTGLEACIAFTGDAEVRLLNAQYRGLDKPTNVLSFAAGSSPVMPGPSARTRFLGDVVLAAETVAAEAIVQGIPLAHHIQHLVVHGVLHLLGFDHETDADATGMETRERLILASLGIADPYSPND